MIRRLIDGCLKVWLMMFYIDSDFKPFIRKVCANCKNFAICKFFRNLQQIGKSQQTFRRETGNLAVQVLPLISPHRGEGMGSGNLQW